MGLDMYMTGHKHFVPDFNSASKGDVEAFDENEGRPVDPDGEAIESAEYRLGYWRKFAPLHHFIVNEFADGKDDCQRIGLGRDDLIKIAEVIEGNKLPANEDCGGCFFGSPEWWDAARADKAHAAQFRAAAAWCEAAPKYESGSLKQWRSVHYQASW